MKIDVGHGVDELEGPVAGVKLLDLVEVLEPLEDAPRGLGETADVRHEVRRNALDIAMRPGEGVKDVVAWMFPVRIDGLAEQAINRRFRYPP